MRRARRALSRTLAALVPYGLGMRAASALWGQGWLVRLVAGKRLRLFARAQPLVGNRDDILLVVRRSLMSSTFRSWGFGRFGQLPRERMDQWLTVEGLDLLEHHYAEHPDRGLVLANSHFGASRVISFYLQLLGYRVTSLESHGLLRALKVKGAENINVLEIGHNTKFFLKQVYHARRALLDGQVFHLAADGYQGTSGEAVPFHGRMRHFARGFADLALRTDVPVYLVFASVREDGGIRIQISGPLDDDGPDRPVAERAERLLRGYIEALERKWTEDLGNVHVPHLRKLMAQSTSGTGSEPISR